MPTTRAAASTALGLACLLSFAGAACAASEDPVDQGRDLLVQFRCGTCHTIPGVPGSRGQVAQPLTAWRHRSYIAGRLPNRPEVLARWIVAPQSLVPGTLMPRMGVSPAQAQAMAAYLFSLE
jgi:mono/diheme cytochrome c family protein